MSESFLLKVRLGRQWNGNGEIWPSFSWMLGCFGRRRWHPTPVLLPGKSHGQRSLVGCSPWGHKELDTFEQLHFHFHALEKKKAAHSSVLSWRIPGTGAWWVAVYGVAQSWTQLMWLSSSSSRLFWFSLSNPSTNFWIKRNIIMFSYGTLSCSLYKWTEGHSDIFL